MDNEEIGIQETKEAMIFGISIAMAIDDITQDGFQWTDILKLVPALTELPKAIDGIQQVPSELGDLSDDERLELANEIEKLDFASDRSEEIAEQSLRVALEIGKLILKIRAYRNKK